MTNAETTTTNEAANVAEQGAPVAPEKTPAKKCASQKKGAPKGQKNVKQTTPFDEPEAAVSSKAANAPAKAKGSKKLAKTKKATKPEPKAKAASERTNKKADVIAMMKRAKGATLPEIMEATGWQAHTVRGFVSLLGSKSGETVESSKNAAGERMYKIAR